MLPDLLIENQPECLDCPADWICCLTLVGGPCESFDPTTKRCLRNPRSLTCLRTVCQHFESYRGGTIQTLYNDFKKLISDEKNVCKGCGGRPELIRLNGSIVEYWCWSCYGSDCFALDIKIG